MGEVNGEAWVRLELEDRMVDLECRGYHEGELGGLPSLLFGARTGNGPRRPACQSDSEISQPAGESVGLR